MDPTLVARLMLPAFALVFVLLGMVWPILRLWRATGVFAVTSLRSKNPTERLAGLLLMLVLAGLVVVVLVYGLAGPTSLGADPPGWGRLVLAALCQAAGVAMIVVAQATMGRSWRIGIDAAPTGLVTTGLYARVRSPIYSGMLLGLGGVVLMIGTIPALLAWGAVLAVLAWQARREEAHVAAQHPAEFPAWAARTGRFLPWIGRIDPG